jgi:hypothetical protein
VAGALKGEGMIMMMEMLLVTMFLPSIVLLSSLMKRKVSMKDMQRQYGKQRSLGMFGYCVL